MTAPCRLARTSAAACLAATAVVLLAACGGPASGPAAGEERTRSPKPAASAPASPEPTQEDASQTAAPQATPKVTVQQAVDATREAGTAAVDLEIDLSVGESVTRITGEGALDFAASTGELAFTFEDGGTVTQIITVDAVYVQLPDQPDVWYEAELDETGLTPLGTGDPAKVLAALERMGKVTRDGTEDVDGVETTRYVGRIDVSDALAASGLSGEQVDRIGGMLEGATATVTAWVDDKGRVVQMQQDFAIDGTPFGSVSSSALVRFSAFGEPVEVLPPPGDQIEPAPEGMFGGDTGGEGPAA